MKHSEQLTSEEWREILSSCEYIYTDHETYMDGLTELICKTQNSEPVYMRFDLTGLVNMSLTGNHFENVLPKDDGIGMYYLDTENTIDINKAYIKALIKKNPTMQGETSYHEAMINYFETIMNEYDEKANECYEILGQAFIDEKRGVKLNLENLIRKEKELDYNKTIFKSMKEMLEFTREQSSTQEK